MSEEKRDPNKYSFFNGQRSADAYVRGWLKGVTIIAGSSLVLGMAFAGWLVRQDGIARRELAEHEIRLVAIESNRFTSQDAADLMQLLNKELQTIRQEISQLPKQSPPKWVADAIYNNAQAIKELQKK